MKKAIQRWMLNKIYWILITMHQMREFSPLKKWPIQLSKLWKTKRDAKCLDLFSSTKCLEISTSVVIITLRQFKNCFSKDINLIFLTRSITCPLETSKISKILRRTSTKSLNSSLMEEIYHKVTLLAKTEEACLVHQRSWLITFWRSLRLITSIKPLLKPKRQIKCFKLTSSGHLKP